AEDGIRDFHVTGVQTCALPILLPALTLAQDDKPNLPRVPRGFDEGRVALLNEAAEGLVPPGALVERLFEHADLHELANLLQFHRSEERRVGKEGGTRCQQ